MRWIKQQIKKVIPNAVLEIRAHWNAHGAFPNIIRPATFSDKVLHRRIFDRRAVLTQIADKAAVRSYVEARLSSEILPKLYYLTTHPETIPFDQLPERFVVKPTHGSAWVQIVTDKAALDYAALIETCRSWLKRSYYRETLEWVYKGIKPQIIVEEFIDDGSGTAPPDYKFFVFHGRVEMVQVDTGRFTGHRRRLFTRDWQKLDVELHFPDALGDVPRPPHLSELIEAAEKLGDGTDFVRADFYDSGKRIYFGELTVYPGAGRERFSHPAFDRKLGDIWNSGGGEAARQKGVAPATVLAWIGGGIVAVAGGLWTVIRFFAGRGEGGSSPSVRADKSSIAIGRDATNSPINVNTRDAAKRLKRR